jgi:hypothetical protein
MSTLSNPTVPTRPKKTDSPVFVAARILLVWFFVARAILYLGVAGSTDQTTLWRAALVLFILTAFYFVVRAVLSPGGWRDCFLLALFLSVGGLGLFQTLPQDLKPVHPRFASTMQGSGDNPRSSGQSSDTPFTASQRLEIANKLIFGNATAGSIRQARSQLSQIAPTSAEYPSAQALLQVTNPTLHLNSSPVSRHRKDGICPCATLRTPISDTWL